LCLTQWQWDRFVFERVTMGQVCICQNGNGRGLCLTEWQCFRFVVDRVAMGQV